MKNKKILLTAMLLGIGIAEVNAQESANASGGIASGSGGSATYSIGQVVYETYSGSTGTVAQGVQQPFEISIVLELEEAEQITLSLLAYPNPTIDNLTLKAIHYDLNSLSYQLFDLNGRLLLNNRMTDIETSIPMLEFPDGVFILKVINDYKEIKTFKILKHSPQ